MHQKSVSWRLSAGAEKTCWTSRKVAVKTCWTNQTAVATNLTAQIDIDPKHHRPQDHSETNRCWHLAAAAWATKERRPIRSTSGSTHVAQSTMVHP